MPRSKSVTLGGVTYEVTQLPMKANKSWRDDLGRPVMRLIDLVQGMGDLELTAQDLGKLFAVVKDVLLGSMDLLLDALFAYSPALAEDRERIENESYDDEAIAALGVCVSLAFPLDRAVTGLIGAGLPVTRTTTNSPSQNGDSGIKLPSTGPRKRTAKT